MGVNIKWVTGEAIHPFRKELATLRIEVFHEYPYLYDGDVASEEDYLGSFSSSPNSILVLAESNGQIIGASTGLPLLDAPTEVKAPWLNQNVVIDDIFYFAESVLRKPFRKKGIGGKFFHVRESWAKQIGCKKSTFCAVIRPDDHPEKPNGYVSLESYWMKKGYRKLDGMVCSMLWKDIQEEKENIKQLQFWEKNLMMHGA